MRITNRINSNGIYNRKLYEYSNFTNAYNRKDVWEKEEITFRILPGIIKSSKHKRPTILEMNVVRLFF